MSKLHPGVVVCGVVCLVLLATSSVLALLARWSVRETEVQRVKRESPALQNDEHYASVLLAQRLGADPRHAAAENHRAASALQDPRFEKWKQERGRLVQGEARARAREMAPKHFHAGHDYTVGQQLFVYGEKMGPFVGGRDGKATVGFFDIPFFNCGSPPEGSRKDEEGSFSLFPLNYRQNRRKVPILSCTLSAEQSTKLYDAIKERWFFEFEIDGLPVHGYLGTEQHGQVKVFRHIDLKIDYNEKENRIVYAHVLTFDHNGMQSITRGQPTSLQYTVTTNWDKTEYSSEDRALRYMMNNFFDDLDLHVEYET
jgi:Endomembrane protein 70